MMKKNNEKKITPFTDSDMSLITQSVVHHFQATWKWTHNSKGKLIRSDNYLRALGDLLNKLKEKGQDISSEEGYLDSLKIKQ